MTIRAQIKAVLLRLLLKMDGMPAPDRTLIGGMQLLIRPAPTESDISASLRELEEDGLVCGALDDVFKTTTWTLTVKGEHKARQL